VLYGLPVSSVSRPAFRVRGTRLLIERMTLYQDLSIQAAVALHRCDEADPAVPMLGVVPAHEVPDPGPGVVQAGKAALRPLRAVFQGAEQRLGEGIVVAHPWPASRGRDTQVIHLGQQGRRLHRCAVVRVQYQRLTQAFLTESAALQQGRRLVARLGEVDFPANGFAAVNILDQVQVVSKRSFQDVLPSR